LQNTVLRLLIDSSRAALRDSVLLLGDFQRVLLPRLLGGFERELQRPCALIGSIVVIGQLEQIPLALRLQMLGRAKVQLLAPFVRESFQEHVANLVVHENAAVQTGTQPHQMPLANELNRSQGDGRLLTGEVNRGLQIEFLPQDRSHGKQLDRVRRQEVNTSRQEGRGVV
jgi:hypothetical protein